MSSSEHTGPVEAIVDVVEEVTTPDPPAWSRHLTDRATRFDEVADGLVDRLRGNAVADRLMYSVTELADFSLLWHLIASARGLRSDRDAREALRLVTVMGIESTLVNVGIKSLFRRERPIPEFERPHHLRIPLTTSFPSGHAAYSSAYVALALAAAIAVPGLVRRVGLLMLGLLLAVVIGLSRIYLRVHYWSDVAGGWALGIAVFSLCAVIALVVGHMRQNGRPPSSAEGRPPRAAKPAAGGSQP